ncbi:MAG TPA: metallophosphoesterase, partial [Bacteroidia bacterium]|nr:metallophosphoesterase [Bacteroidia bacterium]
LGWLNLQSYKKKIFIAGNHDNNADKKFEWDESISYLCDSSTEFEGLKIYGSPWTKTFPRMNPKCKAFTVDTEEELEGKWAIIPEDIDILITHSPPYGILDKNSKQEHCGSESLFKELYRIKPKLHVFGHIHESYGILGNLPEHYSINQFVNASHVNERYQPVNSPVRIDL